MLNGSEARALLRRIVPHSLRDGARRWAGRRGLGAGLGTEDRRLLEQVILPDLGARADLRRVLFVGCAWYTESYERFFPGREYWTLDIDPEQARFGARGGRHLVDSATHAARHFAPGSLDLVVLNGVYGWGLDAGDDLEAAFGGFHACLRPGGLLLVGWNDVPEHTPVPLESIDALKRFAPRVFAPLGAARVPTDTQLRHTFDFYEKPPA